MSEVHGKDAVVKIDSGGTLADISTYVSKFAPKLSRPTKNITTLTAQWDAFLVGVKNGKASMSGPWSAAIDAILWAAFDGDTTVSFEFYPEGTSAGKVKYYGECYVNDYSGPQASVDGEVTYSADITMSGTITRGTVSA